MVHREITWCDDGKIPERQHPVHVRGCASDDRVPPATKAPTTTVAGKNSWNVGR